MSEKKTESQTYYVGIKDPADLRRYVLESSKDLIKMLQNHERFKTARKEKEAQILKLKRILSDINTLISKLKLAFPRGGLIPKKKLPEKREIVSKIESEKNQEKTELEKLEFELKDIENKLDNLV